jgi:EamA domain-containing membrane protein RarD
MNAVLIAAVGVVYFIIAVDSIQKGQIGLGISFLGYALGNVGLYMIAK